MSIQTHLIELERRHQALEREIASERIHPAADDQKIKTLKHRKLILKQEIERIKTQSLSPSLH